MQELVALAPWLVALVSGVSSILVLVDKLRWSNEYRAAQDHIVKAKEAQIAQLQETLKGKGATIETLKLLNYSEAAKHLTAQKELYEQRVADLTAELKRAEVGRAASDDEIARLHEKVRALRLAVKDVDEQRLKVIRIPIVGRIVGE